MKILLVEDHAESRLQLKRLIERRGHSVTAVGSAEEAELSLAQERVPFLILDWMLPGKSGLELCRDLRAEEKNDSLFILLVTARADTVDLEQALEAGANDYLTKPLDFGLLSVRLSVAERQIRELHERNQARAAVLESERSMRNVLENTSDGYFALDFDWRFSYLNAEAERLLQRDRDSLHGQVIWGEFPDLVGTAFETNYRQVMGQQEPVSFEATDARGKKWTEVNAYPSGGGIAVFFRDITERKRDEEERLTTSKLESLGTLAGGIAHDLNNILTVISGNIGLAQIEAPSEASSLLTFLSKAGQAAQHAAHLSSQLLTFSKGGTPVKKVQPMGRLLERAAEFSLYGSNLRADIDVAVNLWAVEVDASQIEQVIGALVFNARDAMPQGGAIRISARNLELSAESSSLLPAGRYVKVTVVDRGAGVPAELATKIFDPYFTTKPMGSGLGLAISYSIVKKHGGVLALESSSGEGATFVFYLPAAKVGPKNTRGIRPLSQQPQLNQHRVLVMDDEPAIRDLTSQLLHTLGYEVTAVADGAEAIRDYERAMLKGENYHAVILDATIRGGLGGVATIERLRSMDPQVIAIICSGYSDEAALAEFLAFGFRSALPKPFTREDLADALQRAFEAQVNCG